MPRTPRYRTAILARTVVYTSKETGEVVNLTETERLMDGINGQEKYTFCELYEKLGEVSANTLIMLDKASWDFIEPIRERFIGTRVDFVAYNYPRAKIG